MPFIEIHLDQALFDEKRAQISKQIHQAQIDVLGVPATDLFQVFTPHGEGEIVFDPTHNGVDRRSLMAIRVTIVHNQPGAVKKALYKGLLERLETIGIRRDDVEIVVVENGFDDWYVGRL